MHDRYFNRIRMFWMVKGHQKNLNSHPDSKKMIKENKTKRMNENLALVKDFTKILVVALSIYAVVAALYVAFWIIGNYGL